jgi:molybdate transport system ATP-binding protein
MAMEVIATGTGTPVKAALSVSVVASQNTEFALRADVAFPPGITILFGASGAGKSTLLDCIAGLVTPSTGRIAVGNRLLFDSAQRTNVPTHLRRAGYLFQTLALFPHLSALKNVGYGLAQLSVEERRQRATALLESFHVAQLANRRPHELSGGERQRVALARALVTDPDFLLLDEPLSGLDAMTKSRILDDLRAWNREHQIPIVYVTHDREEVAALGERVIVLEKGNVIAEGQPMDVLHAPVSETVAQLAGFENIFDATVASVHPEQGSMTCQIPHTGVTLETPVSRATVGDHVRVGIRAGDILLATELPRNLSARNILKGVVSSVEQSARFVVVRADCGVTLEVHLTRGAVESLHVQPQSTVWLLIKTHSCHLLERW